jgi:hypothetical protein
MTNCSAVAGEALLKFVMSSAEDAPESLAGNRSGAPNPAAETLNAPSPVAGRVLPATSFTVRLARDTE